MRTLWFFALIGSTAMAATDFYGLSAENIEGKQAKLSQYKGKVAVVVNTASECGYTPQYKDLEALYQKYKDKGVVVLGFPSNDFGAQEPGSNAEIKKFCELKYRTTFPMFSKAPVLGAQKQPVYQFLTTHAKPEGEVKWNFEKFLINQKGEVVGRYLSKVKPLDSELEKAISELISKS